MMKMQATWRFAPALIVVAMMSACGGDGGNGSAANPGTPNPPTAGTGTSPGGTTPVRTKAFRAAGLVTAAPTVQANASGGQTVSVAVLAQDGVRTLTTAAVAPAQAAVIQASLVPGNLVDWLPSASDPNVATIVSAGSGAGSRRTVTSVTTPSVPSEPTTRWVRS